MNISREIHEIIDKIDAFSRGRMQNKKDVSVLMQLSRDEKKDEVFDDLTFHAKFIYRLFGILQRTAPGSEAYPKLTIEFNDGFEKVSTLMRTLIKEAPDDIKQDFMNKYFTMSHTSLENVIKISYDLSWVKNWRIDGENDSESH